MDTTSPTFQDFIQNTTEDTFSTQNFSDANFSDYYYDYQDPYDVYWQYKVSEQLIVWVAPLLIVLGNIGNLLSFIVLQSSSFKKSSTGFILSALAVVDTGMLNTGLLRHWIMLLTDYYLDVRALTNGSCKAHFFFTYLFAQLSPMTISMMTIDRVISVMLPFRVREICSRRNIGIAWGVIASSLLALNAHFFWTVKLHGYFEEDGVGYNFTYCANKDESEQFHSVAWVWIDATVTCFVPVSLIFVGNSIVIYKLRKSDLMVKSRKGGNKKGTTVMLLIVSTIFLLTTTPSCIFFLGVNTLGLWTPQTEEGLAKQDLTYTIVNLLFYLNNSINFLLYCLSGSNFRNGLKSLFTCGKLSRRLSAFSRKSTKTLSLKLEAQGVVPEQGIDNPIKVDKF